MQKTAANRFHLKTLGWVLAGGFLATQLYLVMLLLNMLNQQGLPEPSEEVARNDFTTFAPALPPEPAAQPDIPVIAPAMTPMPTAVPLPDPLPAAAPETFEEPAVSAQDILAALKSDLPLNEALDLPEPIVVATADPVAEPLIAAAAEPTPAPVAQPIAEPEHDDHAHMDMPMPDPTLTPCVAELQTIADRSRIYFGPNSTELTPLATSVALQMAAAVQSCPEAKITLMGFADPLGSTESNRLVSLRRAQAVVAVIKAAGFETETFNTVSHLTEDHPDFCQHYDVIDRRVEFVVTDRTAEHAAAH
ncbi:OmpA family protein [Tropicibacter naphthalenivorans]|uniref:Peptidoglycan-associated lipoprotein n=1 Tax=Tropicibacter naphthalenivorans TaxID=441103 RepID=A0A0P1G9L1_9RHOB|nr:OmpA family protein [Tropicibacter naphthalenivorans]CUH78266.1 peptidoglycan-associated lipoprotein [Tropicibacter naphthalenivorans]SMC78822.1 Outer membrane protein OmpA [Tropicibacter naphthalenivorans]